MQLNTPELLCCQWCQPFLTCRGAVMASCRTGDPDTSHPNRPKQMYLLCVTEQFPEREPKCRQRTWRCQGFFLHGGKMGHSSLLRGTFSGKDIQRVPVPLSLRQCVRAKARASVLCSHLSPAADTGGWVSLENGAVIKLQILTTFILSLFAGKISQMGRNPSKGRDQPQAKHLSWHLRPSSTSGFGQPWLRRCWTRLCSTLLITVGKESSRSKRICWTDAFKCLQQGISSKVFGKSLWSGFY